MWLCERWTQQNIHHRHHNWHPHWSNLHHLLRALPGVQLPWQVRKDGDSRNGTTSSSHVIVVERRCLCLVPQVNDVQDSSGHPAGWTRCGNRLLFLLPGGRGAERHCAERVGGQQQHSGEEICRQQWATETFQSNKHARRHIYGKSGRSISILQMKLCDWQVLFIGWGMGLRSISGSIRAKWCGCFICVRLWSHLPYLVSHHGRKIPVFLFSHKTNRPFFYNACLCFQLNNTAASSALNDTQLSTIRLDEFSVEHEAETLFHEPPAAEVGRQDQS